MKSNKQIAGRAKQGSPSLIAATRIINWLDYHFEILMHGIAHNPLMIIVAQQTQSLYDYLFLL